MAEFQVVKYKCNNLKFEILTNSGSVLKFRNGELKTIEDVLFSDNIYLDHKKGTRPSKEQMKTCFDKKKPAEILKLMIEKGELQVSQGENQDARDQKHAQVVSYIHRNYVNPSTKQAHPITRIENALAQIKFSAAKDADADIQAKNAVKKLTSILPLRELTSTAEVTVKYKYAQPCISILKRYGMILSSRQGENGDQHYTVDFAFGERESMMKELDKLTSGAYNMAISEGGSQHQKRGEKGKQQISKKK